MNDTTNPNAPVVTPPTGDTPMPTDAPVTTPPVVGDVPGATQTIDTPVTPTGDAGQTPVGGSDWPNQNGGTGTPAPTMPDPNAPVVPPVTPTDGTGTTTGM